MEHNIRILIGLTKAKFEIEKKSIPHFCHPLPPHLNRILPPPKKSRIITKKTRFVEENSIFFHFFSDFPFFGSVRGVFAEISTFSVKKVGVPLTHKSKKLGVTPNPDKIVVSAGDRAAEAGGGARGLGGPPLFLPKMSSFWRKP